MRRLTILSIPAGGSAKMEPGKLILTDDTIMPNLRPKVVITFANSSGAGITLTDAQKQAFLAGLILDLSWGAGGKHKPYSALPLNLLDTGSRYLGAAEWQGYSDAVLGLAQVIPATGSMIATFYPRIPTGALPWQDETQEGIAGMGQQQALSVALSVRRNADVLPANVTITGNITMELIPDEAPAHGEERIAPVATFWTWSEQDKVVKLADSIPVALFETTNPHASATMTSNTLQVGDTVLYEQISPVDYGAVYRDVPNVPTAADVSDRVTLCYVNPRRKRWDDMKAGPIKLTQTGVKMGSFAAFGIYYEYVSPEQMDADLALFTGADYANKPMLAVTYSAAKNLPTPAALIPSLPVLLFPQSDHRYESLPGRLSGPSIKPQYYLPSSQRVKQSQQKGLHAKGGEQRSAEKVARLVASAIPAAVSGSYGFDGGSSDALTWARSQLGG